MSKSRSVYVCQGCGHTSNKWAGQCGGCGEWNTLTEETTRGGERNRGRTGSGIAFKAVSAPSEPLQRQKSGLDELDRVLGGGIVPGAAILIGGDPGIGKSTLLFQTAAKLDAQGVPTYYISGEESERQVRLRASRLGYGDCGVSLAEDTDAFAIAQSMRSMKPGSVVIVDSIQSMTLPEITSAAGTVSQIRGSANEIIRAAKERDIAVFIIGHVTKDAQIAGPKTLEHAVDTVIYFQSEQSQQFRILRAVKNRFGATDEIGVFTMTDGGLEDVLNASELFLSERHSDVAGSAVFPGIEGTRPFLVEIQALVAKSAYGSPRRTVVGWDNARLAMVLAVLEARAGLSFADQDVYLNVAGGFRIEEPAADVAVVAALVSALGGMPLPPDTVYFGELGLGGELRPVGLSDQRMKEAHKLGFARAVAPDIKGQSKSKKAAIDLDVRKNIQDLIAGLAVLNKSQKDAA